MTSIHPGQLPIPARNDGNTPKSTASARRIPKLRWGIGALLGVGVNGDQTNQSFVVAYTDGTKTTAIQSMSNWNTPQGYPGESIALAMPYKIMSNGTVHSGNYKLYGYAIALDPTKTVASLALPNDRDVVILAVDLVP